MVVTQFAPLEEGRDLVSASQTTLETPMLPADLNVLLILTVPQTKHANSYTASILARVPVGLMQSAEFRTTSPLVPVFRDILGTHSLHAD